MEDHYNSAKLHAIYAALDSHNYTRALKLSQHKSVSSWKITLALRCHTLRRLGRKEECIVLLKNDLLSYIKVDPENDEMSILLDRLRRDKGQGDMVQGNNNGNGQSEYSLIFDEDLNSSDLTYNYFIDHLENAEFVAKKIIEKNLSVRQAENFVKIFKIKKQSFKGQRDINLQSLENSVREKIGLNVLIKNKKNNTGSLIFEYKDLDQLNKIIDIIKSNY